MVSRNDEEEKKVEPKKEEEEVEDQVPVVPNYLDLILGELHAVRLLLEESNKKK